MDLIARPFEEYIGKRDLAQWKSPPGRLIARMIMWASRFTTWRWMMLLMVAAGMGVIYACVNAVGEILDVVHEKGAADRIDQPLLEFSMRHRPAWAASSVTWFTHIGGSVITPIIAVLVLGFLTWRWKTWTPLMLGAIAGAGSLAMTIAGKLAVGRPRPPLADAVPPYEHSFSFPSGHAMNAVVIAGVIAYVLMTRAKKKRTMLLIGLAAGVYAVAMGLSRVYLGHHWFTDVAAGWVVGGSWLLVVITAHRLHLTHHRYHEQLAKADKPEQLDELDEKKAPGTVA